jgi:cytidylate kinase
VRRNGLVVAIDGPSGAGKSTVGRTLAQRLGYTFIDTGAMYRAIAWRAHALGVALDDAIALGEMAASTRIELVGSPPRVFVDGSEITADIRTQAASQAASRVSAHPAVRRALVARQRELGRDGGVVMDGRDIGSVVFPDAEVKVYLDASPRQRADRRHRELAGTDIASDVDTIERQIRARDEADSTRADSPLTRLPDALYVDSSALTPEQVVERLLAVVHARGAQGDSEGGRKHV